MRELSHYLPEHPGEVMALTPLYEALREHARLRACRHANRCPLVMTGPVVVNESGNVLAVQHGGKYMLFEDEPKDQGETLPEAALRLLAEKLGVRDVWTEPGTEGPFVVDVTPIGQHQYGPRIRVGFRYLFAAHSRVIETPGRAAWVPPAWLGLTFRRALNAVQVVSQ
ncbi:NUDIX hydrolase [Streptomyces sp. NPDC050095]|uniref:NUDIX hydrolase n=1 Tax=unclassified Streptomyces TaxID=2593676 RepID=UPI0034241F62